jgi:hypothetical protein
MKMTKTQRKIIRKIKQGRAFIKGFDFEGTAYVYGKQEAYLGHIPKFALKKLKKVM